MKWRELRSQINQVVDDEDEIDWIELEYPKDGEMWVTKSDDGGVVILSYDVGEFT